jgi:hypothetical protein
MQVVQIDNWREYQRDGEQFLQTARAAWARRARAFSPNTLYNLVCMAIEKLIMAFLMKNGDLAENHTMGDLLFALERHLGSQPGLSENLLFLDRFQEICDLETYTIRIPEEQDVEAFLAIGDQIQALLLPHLND